MILIRRNHLRERSEVDGRACKGNCVWRVVLCCVWLAVATASYADQDIQPVQATASGTAEKKGSEDLKKLSLEDLMNVEVKEVTTASKRAEKATETPGMAYVIDKNDIKLRGYSNLKDVLRDLPGMETTEYYFSEIGTQVPVRGIVGNNKIVVMVNGMRVNPPGGENFPFRSDFSVRDAEQIEVIYGPGSTLYGRDAASAVINVKTKQPEEGVHGEAGFSGGLNNEREAWATFGKVFDKDNNISLTGYVQYHDSDLTSLDKEYSQWWQDYRTAAETRGTSTSPLREDYGLNTFARFEAGDFSFQVWYRDSKRSSTEGLGTPSFAYVEEAVWEDFSIVTEAKYSAQLADNIRLDSSVTFNRYEIDPSTRYVWQNPAPAVSWNYDDFKYGLGYSYTIEETLKVDITDNISLLAGLVATYNDIMPKSTVPGGANTDNTLGGITQQGGSFQYWKAVGDGPYLIPRVSHVTYQVYGGYVETGWQAMERLRLIGGVRFDKDSRIDEISFTPRAGLIWNATDEWTAKYTYSTAYVSPPPYFAYNVYQNTTQLSTTNPNLQPETSTTHEVDFNYTKENFQAGVGLYYGEQSNLLLISDRGLPQNTIGTVYLDAACTQPITLVQSANGGTSTSYGSDIYARMKFGPVSPWASYSYTSFEMINNGVSSGLQGISKHNGRLGITWAITPKLFVTPSLVIRSTPENVSSGTLDAELDTPYEVNLYMLWAATKHVDVFANVRNLTDNHYALYGISGVAVPQEALNGVLGVRVTF
ncbi:MAG: TonB-dependent receptor [Verrucomicrobiia bacterium]